MASIEIHELYIYYTVGMLIGLELDVDKYHNKSLIRSTFSDTKTNFYEQNYTFKANHKKCFNQLISVKVSTLLNFK